MFSIAYMNIAIIKYWCKDRYDPYLVPLVPSISLRSKHLYTKTSINSSVKDEFYLNDKLQDEKETKKVFDFVDKVIKNREERICIKSYNKMPTAAGLASSASAYSALTMELNRYFKLNLTKEELAKISSIGSGSSCRSFYEIAAFDENGNIYELKTDLKFCMSAVIISKNKKSISSREAMKISKETSTSLDKFVRENKRCFNEMKEALLENDFDKVGNLMQESTELMHETMKNSTPSINYLKKESIDCINYIKSLNKKGYKVYYTTDAGPNVKVLYQEKNKDVIRKILEEKYKGDLIDVI